MFKMIQTKKQFYSFQIRAYRNYKDFCTLEELNKMTLNQLKELFDKTEVLK